MRKSISFEAQLARLALISSVPPLLFLLGVMAYADVSIWLILLTALIGSTVVSYTSHRIYQKSVYKFRSLNNLLEALILRDYSLRAHPDESYGALSELVKSINGLAGHLSQQRLESVESQLLLRTVIDHIDVAILALTEKTKVSFLNPAAKKLLQLDRADPGEQLLQQLAFVQSFPSGKNEVVELSLGRQQGRFNVHVEEFRESGVQHRLLFITDVRTLLRSEERKAWQSLVRVISHEINNSLAPIASISQTLSRLILNNGFGAETNKDTIEGLTIIAERANGLRQFVDSYKQLARLPEPRRQKVSISTLVEKVRILFKGHAIIIESDIDARLFIDPVQFEQVLINLFKNSVEAMSKKGADGVIRVGWIYGEHLFKLKICDQGVGISNPENLFVPFYSTKKHGSGIGLLLCRQIVEAHNGYLTIANQENSQGCCVTIEIPHT